MITAVLDANTLASGAVASRGTLSAIVEAWQRGDFGVIASSQILQELERTLAKPYFAKRLDQATVADYLALVRVTATAVLIPAAVPRVATHPEDHLILATAVSGRAHYLVTGDKKLQELGTYQGVTVLSPHEFLRILTAARFKPTPG